MDPLLLTQPHVIQRLLVQHQAVGIIRRVQQMLLPVLSPQEKAQRALHRQLLGIDFQMQLLQRIHLRHGILVWQYIRMILTGQAQHGGLALLLKQLGIAQISFAEDPHQHGLLFLFQLVQTDQASVKKSSRRNFVLIQHLSFRQMDLLFRQPLQDPGRSDLLLHLADLFQLLCHTLPLGTHPGQCIEPIHILQTVGHAGRIPHILDPVSPSHFDQPLLHEKQQIRQDLLPPAGTILDLLDFEALVAEGRFGPALPVHALIFFYDLLNQDHRSDLPSLHDSHHRSDSHYQ